MKTLVTGAGGMIGGHLVRALLARGEDVRAVDIKPLREWWQLHSNAQNLGEVDCRLAAAASHIMGGGVTRVYHLAENMGGIGFITKNRVACAESVEIGISVLRAADAAGVRRFLFSSSACVYPVFKQQGLAPQLQEREAWPAEPESGYGLAKLYMEELCRHYAEERGLSIRIARYHNVYGPYGSWNDGREKAPAALARKVAHAVKSGEPDISIWGDGQQERSYLYVDDCVAGTLALMDSWYESPVNIGSSRAVSVDDLVTIFERLAGVTLKRHYSLMQATGVRGRNADISIARDVLDWEPKVPLEAGLRLLYNWVSAQL